MRILLTGVGCPGAHALITNLKRCEPGLYIVGTDASPDPIGRWLCDDFARVPWAHEPGYAVAVADLAAQYRVDIVFPQTSWETYALAKERAVVEQAAPLLASDFKWVAICEDKHAMYEHLRGKMAVPRYALVRTLAELEAAAARLGYPERDVVFKPPRGKGSRGVRVLSERADRYTELFERRPYARYMTLDELRTTVGERELPELMVMEYLEGEEYKIDPVALEGEMLVGSVKHRMAYGSGLAMRFAMLDRPDQLEYGREVLRHIPLSWCVDICTRGEHLMEINPRVSTFIYGDDYCPPWLALKLALGEMTYDEVRAYQERVPIGRRMFRYYCQRDY